MRRLPGWLEELLILVGIAANVVGLLTIPAGAWLFAVLLAGVAAFYMWSRLKRRSLRRHCASTSPLLAPVQPNDSDCLTWKPADEQEATRRMLGLGAYILLRWEQLGNGTWSKSYVYRVTASGSAIALSRGSLTGSYFGLYSVLCANPRLDALQFSRLQATLNGLRSGDGTYRRLKRVATGGAEHFDIEPPRHAAGALLARLLLSPCDEVDRNTVEWLSKQSLSTPLDIAFVARALRVWAIDHGENLDLIGELAARLRPEANIMPSQYWRQSDLAYVPDTTYQWCVVWTMLPFLQDQSIPPEIRHDLESAVREMVRHFLGLAFDTDSLLPGGFDSHRRPCGESLLGTSVSMLAATVCRWETEYQSLANRLFSGTRTLLALPTEQLMSGEQTPVSTATEMYLSWGALLQVCGVLGCWLTDEKVNRVDDTLGAWSERAPTTRDSGLNKEFANLPSRYIRDIHRAATAVERLCEQLDAKVLV